MPHYQKKPFIGFACWEVAALLIRLRGTGDGKCLLLFLLHQTLPSNARPLCRWCRCQIRCYHFRFRCRFPLIFLFTRIRCVHHPTFTVRSQKKTIAFQTPSWRKPEVLQDLWHNESELLVKLIGSCLYRDLGSLYVQSLWLVFQTR